MTEETTDITSSGYRDSIVTYSTNVGESSEFESDTSSQRNSYLSNSNSSQIDNNFNSNNNVGDSETPTNKTRNINDDDDDDDDESIIKGDRPTPFYKKKRFWAIFCIVNVILAAIMIPITLLVIFPAIVQKTMDGSTININSLLVKSPQESSFKVDFNGGISNGGPYNAKVEFPDPVTVYYNGAPLGSMNLDQVSVKGGNGQMEADEKLFTILDPNTLISFTTNLLISETIEWEFKGSVKVTALGLTKNHIKLDKIITLNGAGGFKNTTVENINIQQNSTTNNVDLEIVALINNPSPLGIELGVLQLEVYYNTTLVAPVTTDSFTLLPGENRITMKGSAVPPPTDQDKFNVESFLTSFINGKSDSALAKGVSSTPDAGNTVDWLNTVVKQLQLSASLAPKDPAKIITAIDFGQMVMSFNDANAYAPLISSTNSTASYTLPFQINLQVNQVAQNVTIYTQDQIPIASLVSGFSTATNDNTTIYMNIPESPLQSVQTDVGKQYFQDFIKNLTVGTSFDYYVVGTSDVTANTVLGNLTLKGIPLNTTTTLLGFQGLNVKPPVISNLTVTGGTADGLVLGLNVDLYNPTTYSLNIGTAKFQMTYLDQVIGIATVANLSMVPADSILAVTATVDPNNSPLAKEVLNSYLNGTNVTVQISGYNESTTIPSLIEALSSLTMSSDLPPLGSKLVGKSSLEFLPDTIANNGLAKASVELINPFAADLSISSIQATLGFHGKQLATININDLSTPIVAVKEKTTNIHGLPIKLNIEPSFLFGVLRQSASDGGLDLTPIDTLLTLGGFTDIEGFEPIDVSSVDPSTFKNFNIIDYSKQAIAAMAVDISMVSTVTVGDYTFSMSYTQYNVSSSTDDSLAFIIGPLSVPIVQKIVDSSTISFEKIFLQNPSETSFTASITGTISEPAPFDASISFPNGASLSSDNTEFGTMTLPDIKAVGGKASLDNVQTQFTVTNTQVLGDFTVKILTTNSASWTINAKDITVSALGLAIPNINLVQSTELKGANGFLNDIQVENFAIVGVAPQGGLESSIKANLKNVATVGVELGTVNFDTYFEGTFVGPATALNAIILPQDTSSLVLGSRVVPPTSQKDIDTISKLLKLMFNGETVQLQTVGDSVITKNGPVSWLTEAIKSINVNLAITAPKTTDESVITLDTATITDITANNYNVHMIGEVSKTGALPATLSYPNGVDVIYDNGVIGNTKMSPIDVQPNVISKIDSISPFTVTNQDGLAVFTGDLLGKDSVSWELKTDDLLLTVGGIPISGLPFDKEVDLIGYNGLKNAIKLNGFGFGTPDPKGLPVTVNITITNPSNVGIELGTVVFDTFVQKKPFSPLTGQNILLAAKVDNNIIFDGEITDFSVIVDLLKEKSPSIRAVGKSVEPPKAGGSPVPWLQEPFTKLEFELPVVIDPKSLPGFDDIIQAIQIEDMSIVFTPQTAFNPSTSSKKMVATVKLPFPLPIKSVSEEVTIIDQNNAKVASLSIPSTPVAFDPKANTMTVAFNNIALTAIDQNAFTIFMAELMVATDKSFTLAGTATTDALPIPLPFNVTTSIKGLQGLKSSPVTLGKVVIDQGTAKSLNIDTTVTINNPSPVAIEVGSVNLNVFSGDSQIGIAAMNDLKLVSGSNQLATVVQVFPAKTPDDAIATFFGTYMSGDTVKLAIKGGTTEVKSLVPIFAAIQLDSDLPGLPQKLINNITIDLGASTATVSMTNLLNKDIVIDGIDVTASMLGAVIGKINIPDIPKKPVLKAQATTSVTMPFSLGKSSLGSTNTLSQDTPPHLEVDIALTSTISIENYVTPINYKQNGILLILTGLSSPTTTASPTPPATTGSPKQATATEPTNPSTTTDSPTATNSSPTPTGSLLKPAN